MDSLISSLLVSAPTGMWEKILMAFEGAFGSFALSVIIITLLIKICMSPIDYFNRRTNQKMANMQQKIQPKMEAINKKYANDANMRNQKLGELYQKEKINPMGSCSIMLISMALTLTIFITLFNGMNAMASYKIADQYEQLQIAYVQEYAGEELNLNQEKSVYEICLPYIEAINAITDTTQKEEILKTANQNVAKVYKETKQSFLWIDNIWLADSPFKSSIPSYEEYAQIARLKKEDRENEEYKNIYNQIMEPLKASQNRVNGYYILVLLCAAITILNQWLTMRSTKKQKGVKQPGSIFSMVLMTIMMVIFAFMYSSMFSLYMITGQLIGLITTPILNAIGKKVDERKENKNVPTDRLKRI